MPTKKHPELIRKWIRAGCPLRIFKRPEMEKIKLLHATDDKERLAEVTKQMKNNEHYDPIVVSSDWYLVDGHMRLQAVKDLNGYCIIGIMIPIDHERIKQTLMIRMAGGFFN